MSDMTQQEIDWQAQDDAYALMRAKVVEADPERMKRAKTAAADIVKRKAAEDKAMQQVAKGV